MISDYEYMKLSQSIYDPKTTGPDLINLFIPDKYNIGESKWRVLCVEDQNEKNGFYGTSLARVVNGQMTGEDWNSENLSLDWYSPQFLYGAIKLLKDTRNLVNYNRIQNYSYSFTGHSLGGKLAQQMLYECIESEKSPYVEVDRRHINKAVIFNAARTHNKFLRCNLRHF